MLMTARRVDASAIGWRTRPSTFDDSSMRCCGSGTSDLCTNARQSMLRSTTSFRRRATAYTAIPSYSSVPLLPSIDVAFFWRGITARPGKRTPLRLCDGNDAGLGRQMA
jgi:hypothetical protein